MASSDVFISDEGFAAPRTRKRQRPLKALRNYVHSFHCDSPTANSSTHDAEIGITATLNTAIAISTAVDD